MYYDQNEIEDFQLYNEDLDGVEIPYFATGIYTENAALYQMHDGKEEWFPKSQIVDITPTHITIPGWLAARKGFY